MHKFHGKENLIASLNYWLTSTVPGGYIGVQPLPAGKEFFWLFDFPIAPLTTPAISITEIGLFNLGEMAFDRVVGMDETGEEIYGAKNQTLIEIVCTDQDSLSYSSATNKVRNLRDKVVGALLTENIPLIDYSNPGKPKIGNIWVDQGSNSINEKLVVDSQNQNLKRYVIVVRIFWMELEQRTKTKVIKSNSLITE